MKLIRVFPRRTRATPNDPLAYFGLPDLLAEADEVHVSCTFTYDKPAAERLAEQWRHVAPTKLGGVAYGDPGAEFVRCSPCCEDKTAKSSLPVGSKRARLRITKLIYSRACGRGRACSLRTTRATTSRRSNTHLAVSWQRAWPRRIACEPMC
jgi:hypothetical protein